MRRSRSLSRGLADKKRSSRDRGLMLAKTASTTADSPGSSKRSRTPGVEAPATVLVD
jgi:hypothetical protein